MLADPEHEPALRAGALDARHHGLAALPFAHCVGDPLWRILKIRTTLMSSIAAIAARLVKRMHRRADVAEIPGIDDDPPVGVGGGRALQQPLPFRPSTSIDGDVLPTVASERCH